MPEDEFKIQGPSYDIVFTRDSLGSLQITVYDEHGSVEAWAYPTLQEHADLIRWLDK